jgi:hypothetical protein
VPLGCPVNIERTSSMMMLCSVNAFLLLILRYPLNTIRAALFI